MDWILGLPDTPQGNRVLIVAMDCYTHYVMAAPFGRATAANTLEFFSKEIVFRFGLPKRVYLDNGTHFLGEFREHCAKWGVRMSHAAPHNPPAHGAIERVNRDLLERLRRLGAQEQWDQRVNGALLAMNARETRTQKISPLELLMGITPRGPMELAMMAQGQ